LAEHTILDNLRLHGVEEVRYVKSYHEICDRGEARGEGLVNKERVWEDKKGGKSFKEAKGNEEEEFVKGGQSEEENAEIPGTRGEKESACKNYPRPSPEPEPHLGHRYVHSEIPLQPPCSCVRLDKSKMESLASDNPPKINVKMDIPKGALVIIIFGNLRIHGVEEGWTTQSCYKIREQRGSRSGKQSK
jgi:hypothetical protein